MTGSFEQLLFSAGIPSFIQTINVQITSERTIKIADTLPAQIGWIYGINTYADGEDLNGNTLITSANTADLWLQFVQGDTQFVNAIRFDDMLFDQTATGQFMRYLELNIPGTISLDQSLIYNPTGVASGRALLNLRYVKVSDVPDLLSLGIMKANGYQRNRI